MRQLWFMEQLLAVEAEAKYFLASRDRAKEQSFKKELLRILQEAEFLFGPRDSAYELREPLISECFTANVMIYPFRFARIYLSSRCKVDRLQASYEMSHEAIHVLGPAFSVAPTILEEGLATYFSLRYMNRVYGPVFGFEWQNTSDPKYDAALRAVSTLLAENEFVVKELRARQPVISKIDEKLLIDVAGIEGSLAKLLAADFQSYGQEPTPWIERAARGGRIFVNGFRSIWDQSKST